MSDVYGELMARANGGNGHGSLEGTKAVILAGGRGTRLAPYTSILPKPLMPVGERAILELIVDQLASCGIADVYFCVGYLSHLIRAVFDNRANGDVHISYVQEQEALGTAAPLRLVEGLDDTFIAMNGDVLTTLDYRDLVRHHRESENALTIATHERAINIDYGMLHLDVTARVCGYAEKPQIRSSVSMGIYVMEPVVLDFVPEGVYFDFPELVQALIAAGQPVGAYLFPGMWFDIGRQEDYERAVAEWYASSEPNGLQLTGGRATVDAGAADPHGEAENGSAGTAESARRGRGVSFDAFAETFSRVPTAVSVVTTRNGDGPPHGTTVSAFCSLSVDPPLMLVALDRSSDLLRLLEKTRRFGVNLLAADQHVIGRACACKGPGKLAGVSWYEDSGLPRIEGAAAWLACEVEGLIPGGDHLIVVGLVTQCETGDAESLIYHRRGFHRLA